MDREHEGSGAAKEASEAAGQGGEFAGAVYGRAKTRGAVAVLDGGPNGGDG